MAELENNLNTTEEVVETMEEAVQPDAKSEKGDAKPVKQGSSDAESIGQVKLKSSNLKKILLTKQLAAKRKLRSVTFKRR